MKGVHICINQNISDDCGVREEGCRAMAKLKGRLDRIDCILVSNSGWDNKIGVAGSRFLRGVAVNVYCDWKYRQ